MTTSLEALVAQFDTRDKPPVESWNPEKAGEIDIRIDRQGDWYHGGSKIERKRMVALFSTILWHENGSYFLKTPHEKLQITCLLYTSPSPRDATLSRMPSSA